MSTAQELPKQVTERMLIQGLKRALEERLPAGWTVDKPQTASSATAVDALMRFSSPAGESARIAVNTKSVIDPRNVAQLTEQLVSGQSVGAWDIGLVAARYLSPSVRNKLADSGLSYVDATGNIYIRSDAPALFIADRGLDLDPWRGPGRPRGNLKGEPAARVARTLLDAPGPWRMRQLATAARTSTGSAYRVVEFLESEALLVRNDDSTVGIPAWEPLLRRWSLDYEFLATNVVTQWIAPRGIESVIGLALATDPSKYAVTGSVAAQAWAPYAPPRSLMAYAQNPSEIAQRWGLRATDSGANVLLAEPAYSVLTDGARQREDGLSIAAPTQVAVDLLTGPGRAPGEAEELIRWMAANESLWR